MFRIDEDTILISSDYYIEKKADELGVSYSEAFNIYVDEATKWISSEVERAIREQKNIVWDQTNLTIKARKKKLARIPKVYEKIAYSFKPDSPQALHQRMVTLRPEKIIPLGILVTMARDYQEPTVDEGFSKVVNIPPFQI